MEPSQIEYFIHGCVVENTAAVAARLDEKSCYVLGTNINESARDPVEGKIEIKEIPTTNMETTDRHFYINQPGPSGTRGLSYLP